MKNKIELKPCPFCGGEAIRLIDFDDECERVDLESIHCRSCHARVAWQETVEEAIEAWNRRVTNDERQYQIETLSVLRQ